MQRVLIIGCSGAGKSTAARQLATITGLPVVHLDQHYWQPGWVPLDGTVWRAKVAELTAQPRWIMDGNYGGTLDMRARAADTVIDLNFSTLRCLTRVMWRTLTGFVKLRPDVGPGCPERFDSEFFRFVLSYRREHRPRIAAKLAGFSGTLHCFTSPRQLETFLAALAAQHEAKSKTAGR